ncbi:MAG: ribosome maturation factor RimM [Candidatus Cryptobacteroides sp.]
MLRIAKILKSNGVEGGLLVSSPDFDLREIEEPVFIYFDGLPVPYFISDCVQRGQNRFILRLNDIESLKDAEELVGKDLFLDAELEDFEEGELPIDYFEGWQVLDKGRQIGIAGCLEPIPGNPCLNVNTSESGSLLIPLHEDFILSAQDGVLSLDLPEGLY